MNLSPGRPVLQASPGSGPVDATSVDSFAVTPVRPALQWLDADEPQPQRGDPGTVILTCANCGAEMIERKCKLICRCGYFLSCSDYY